MRLGEIARVQGTRRAEFGGGSGVKLTHATSGSSDIGGENT